LVGNFLRVAHFGELKGIRRVDIGGRVENGPRKEGRKQVLGPVVLSTDGLRMEMEKLEGKMCGGLGRPQPRPSF
jgi:hypothetical protein